MVRCAGCGYLGVRCFTTQQLVSPSEDQRRTGKPTESYIRQSMHVHNDILSDGLAVDMTPMCALGVWDLGQELHDQVGGVRFLDWAPKAKDVMQKDRECSSFVKWKSGLTPKEHMDMLATQEMLDAQAARLDMQAERERAWRNEDLERTRQQRNEDIALLKASMRINMWIPVLSVVIGALLAALLAWLLQVTPLSV